MIGVHGRRIFQTAGSGAGGAIAHGDWPYSADDGPRTIDRPLQHQACQRETQPVLPNAANLDKPPVKSAISGNRAEGDTPGTSAKTAAAGGAGLYSSPTTAVGKPTSERVRQGGVAGAAVGATALMFPALLTHYAGGQPGISDRFR